jgi:hypothetical protein
MAKNTVKTARNIVGGIFKGVMETLGLRRHAGEEQSQGKKWAYTVT